MAAGDDDRPDQAPARGAAVVTRYFTASSVDGFIADPEHSLSWLLSRDVDARGPMGYERFVEECVGALAMGSTTYRWVVEHELGDEASGPWPFAQPTWVFSTRPQPQVRGDVRLVSGDVGQPHADMVAAAGERGVWVVGGGELAGQFADAGLLDEVWVQYAPVTLGAGAPLLPRRLELRLEEVVRNRDFACARYAVLGRPPGVDRPWQHADDESSHPEEPVPSPAHRAADLPGAGA